MAETFSTEYTAQYITVPRGNVSGVQFRFGSFSYTQAANGTAGDTILLIKLPPQSVVDMYRSWFAWAGWTSGATLSVGWKAYVDMDGAAQAASAAGLLSAVSLTADGAWSHGMLVVATPDDSNPVTAIKDFNNRDEVILFATIGTQAPGAADTLSGSLCYRHP